MAYQDRPYYRDRSSASSNPLMWLLNGSLPLLTIFGIRVRVHASLILLILLELVLAETKVGLGPRNAITAMSILFVSVLLHEFGHCFGARMMGGEAHEILMWPLGGLASTDPPHRPWPSFVTTAMGPAVNFFICILTGAAITLLNHSIPWFPFSGKGLLSYVPSDEMTYYLWWIFLVNYALLVFNLMLAFYPFDGGRMIQEILWARVGYYRSMLFATVVGMGVALIVAAVSIAFWSLMLLLIAAFGFYACFRQRQMLREVGAEEWQDSTDYSAAYESSTAHSPHATPHKRRRHISRRAIKKVRRMAEQAIQEQQRIDAILAKVSAHGMASLTWFERRALHKATERQRKRDLEEVVRGH